MDTKYDVRYVSGTTDTTYVTSLVNSGTVRICQGHWLAVVAPDVVGTPDAHGNIDVTFSCLDWAVTSNFYADEELKSLVLASWSTRTRIMGKTFQELDSKGLLDWETGLHTWTEVAMSLAAALNTLPEAERVITTEDVLSMPLAAFTRGDGRTAENAWFQEVRTGVACGPGEPLRALQVSSSK